MTYTIININDKKQLEYNITKLTITRARCALPMPIEFYPVEWMHIPLYAETGTANNFPDWEVNANLRTLVVAVQRLAGCEKTKRQRAGVPVCHRYKSDILREDCF